MNRYKVTVTYDLVIFAPDENQAAIIAQTDLASYIVHPQTNGVISASIRVEKPEGDRQNPVQKTESSWQDEIQGDRGLG